MPSPECFPGPSLSLIEYANGISHVQGQPQHSVIPLDVKVYHNEATYIQRIVVVKVDLTTKNQACGGVNLRGTKHFF